MEGLYLSRFYSLSPLCKWGLAMRWLQTCAYLALHGVGETSVFSGLSPLFWLKQALSLNLEPADLLNLASLPQGPAHPGALTHEHWGHRCTALPCECWGPRWWYSFLHGECLIYQASPQPSQCFLFFLLFLKKLQLFIWGKMACPMACEKSSEVSSLLPCGSWGANSGCLAW